jgi:uncharacterized membrane protein
MPSDDPQVPYELYGHEFTHGEWMQLMIHFYRGEMNRATVWRQRLDVTTNWAMAATAGMLTYLLSDPRAPHGAIILAVGVVFVMLHIETRRYMYFDLWRSRLRILERGLIAPALWKESALRELEHESDWRRLLADDLHRARFHLPYSEAFGRRLLRNYIWLLLLCYAGWLLKLGIWPEPARTFGEFAGHAHVGVVPGLAVLIGATLFLVLAALVGYLLARHRHARGEAQPYRHPEAGDRWGSFDSLH